MLPPDNNDLRTYLFSYRYDGAEWALELKAHDADDAKARLAALTSARLDGVLVAEVPYVLGPLAAAAVAIRNGCARLFGGPA